MEHSMYHSGHIKSGHKPTASPLEPGHAQDLLLELE